MNTHGTRFRLAGFGAGLAAVALVTAAVKLLEGTAPVLSLGVLYVFAVLPIAVVWGTAYAVVVAIASMLAFNFLFLPPLFTFTLTDSQNWVALGVYLVTAIVVSELAARARSRAALAEQRAREASFLAQTSATLLESRHLGDHLGAIGCETARILGSSRARIEFESVRRPDREEAALDLAVGRRYVGRLFIPQGELYDHEAADRVLPGLASLLADAGDRERLARRAVEAETLRRSDAVKTAILRSVSHDLRTPLTTIRTASEALTNPSLTLAERDRAELIDAIGVESRRLSRLIENLLELSRLEAGAAAPRRSLHTVDDLVGRALSELGDGGARIQVALPADLPPVRVDSAQIERALHNVLDNAVRYSPPDSAVQLSVERREDELLVRITDFGPGIPEGELGKVFEPFERGGDGRAHGVGLGLAVARGFAQANDGVLWAESAPGKGATFVLALPTISTSAGVPA